jgi:hypothetical protein
MFLVYHSTALYLNRDNVELGNTVHVYTEVLLHWYMGWLRGEVSPRYCS